VTRSKRETASQADKRRPERLSIPLDGLVNLFDLGIVLSVAFLLAALSSLHLTSTLTGKAKARAEQSRSAEAVVADRGQSIKEVKLRPGQRVVGHGKPLGTLYRLSDGRTVIVKAKVPQPSE
jgi:hypothetical protein